MVVDVARGEVAPPSEWNWRAYQLSTRTQHFWNRLAVKISGCLAFFGSIPLYFGTSISDLAVSFSKFSNY